MKYKLVIFDFDGTLADSFPWFAGVINEVADKYRFKKIAEREQETLRGYTVNQILKHLDVPVWKIPKIAHHLREQMAQDIHEIALFDGVGALLQHLSQQGATLAVVSSNSYENIRQVLGDNAGAIHHYECGIDVFGKASKLRKVLAKSKMRPEDAIYIGDEIRDIEAAHEVHIASGSVTWGYNRADVLRTHTPCEIFNSLEEIVEKVG
ncbi:MAG: HAD-IA family hydrolase [Anaerolineae bacterium]|nr:HAD-IA family hydrolase [Anaerolineae bacterium]